MSDARAEQERLVPERRPPAAPEALAQALLAQLDRLWEVELEGTPMAVDFDPGRSR